MTFRDWRAKKSCWMGQNGCPIWLVAQKAILGLQSIAYYFGIPGIWNLEYQIAIKTTVKIA